jgi:hypothetical protein
LIFFDILACFDYNYSRVSITITVVFWLQLQSCFDYNFSHVLLQLQSCFDYNYSHVVTFWLPDQWPAAACWHSEMEPISDWAVCRASTGVDLMKQLRSKFVGKT